jgi:hypothetical protein
MPRTLYLPGTTIAGWAGVQVWQGHNNVFANITATWNWSATHHQHYEVARFGGGSYWVPVSTHPPHVWGGSTPVVGSHPTGVQPVNPYGNEQRPDTTYIWIPDASIPGYIVPGITTNWVICGYPTAYPPPHHVANLLVPEDLPRRGVHRAAFRQQSNREETAMLMLEQAHATLDDILSTTTPTDVMKLAAANQDAFSDSDGLISFVNLSSSFVTNNPEFATGRAVCDKISNFYSTIREPVFDYLVKNPAKVPPGDAVPKTKWDPAVNDMIKMLLAQAGGLTNFSVTNETYSATQVIADFNTSFLKLIFDAAVVPASIISQVGNFITSVGDTLRASWDDRSRTFATALLGQCHEAVPVAAGSDTTIYFPKVKYYRIEVDSSQQEFTSPCTSVKKVTFNFNYTYYVTGLKASILDPTSSDYKQFVSFLDKQQNISYDQAQNLLDQILNGTVSSAPSGQKQSLGMLDEMNTFGVDLMAYPKALIQPHPSIESVLNGIVAETNG